MQVLGPNPSSEYAFARDKRQLRVLPEIIDLMFHALCQSNPHMDVSQLCQNTPLLSEFLNRLVARVRATMLAAEVPRVVSV